MYTGRIAIARHLSRFDGKIIPADQEKSAQSPSGGLVMHDDTTRASITRRELLERTGKVAGLTLIATPFLGAWGTELLVTAQAQPLLAVAGVDRVVMKSGKTYLNGW